MHRYYEDRKKGRSAQFRLDKQEIEDAICKRVKVYLQESGLLEQMLNTSCSDLTSKFERIDLEIKAKQGQLTLLGQTLEGFGDYLRKAALGGELDRLSEIVISEKQKVEQETQEVRGQIQGLEQQKATLQASYQENALREKMRQALADLSKSCGLRKQQLLQAIVPKIIVYPDNRLDIEINPLFKLPDGSVPRRGGFSRDGSEFVFQRNGVCRSNLGEPLTLAREYLAQWRKPKAFRVELALDH